jgi:hypothetical protein
MAFTRSCIIVTSDEPWGVVWHTQLHYAWQLSLRFKVIFVNPPQSWRFKNLFFRSQPDFSVSGKLTVVPYQNVLPSFLGIAAMFINDWITQIRIRKAMNRWKGISVSHAWHFDRYRGFFLFRNDRSVKHVYHIVDPYLAEKNDSLFAKSADLIVLTSPKHFNHYLAINPNTIRMPQGVDLDFYIKQKKQQPTDTAAGYEDSILLLGTLTNDVDFDFLSIVADKYPGKLLIIGPDKINVPESRVKFENLLSIPSVRWLGPMQPEDFLPFLLSCRVGVIVYRKTGTDSNNLRSPLKVINYLASGKCVISNIDCEIPALENEAIYKADSQLMYLQLLDTAMNGNLKFNHQLVAQYLNDVSYDHLVGSIFKSMDQSLPPKFEHEQAHESA